MREIIDADQTCHLLAEDGKLGLDFYFFDKEVGLRFIDGFLTFFPCQTVGQMIVCLCI